MQRFSRILFFIVLTLAGKTFAYNPKEGNVTAILGPYIYRTNFSGSESLAAAPYIGGLALIADGDISDKGSLEIALIHMNKIFVRDMSGKYIEEEAELMHVSMGYRYWLNPYFSTALALYSTYSIGDYRTLHSDFPSGEEIDTSARDITEYGLTLSLQSDLWSNEHWSILLDGRYGLNITKKSDEHSDFYFLMFGIKYLIQEKEASASSATSTAPKNP